MYPQVPIGAVIIDPANEKVLASCHDLRNLGINPLQHAVMVCIDLVAKGQGGGAWQFKGQQIDKLHGYNFTLRKKETH